MLTRAMLIQKLQQSDDFNNHNNFRKWPLKRLKSECLGCGMLTISEGACTSSMVDEEEEV